MGRSWIEEVGERLRINRELHRKSVKRAEIIMKRLRKKNILNYARLMDFLSENIEMYDVPHRKRGLVPIKDSNGRIIIIPKYKKLLKMVMERNENIRVRLNKRTYYDFQLNNAWDPCENTRRGE